MKIQLDASGVVLPKAESQALAARLKDAFARQARRIDQLYMSIREVANARGGRDTVCMIRVELARNGQIVVRERCDKPGRAIGKAMRRARALLAFEIKRRSREGRRPLVLEHVEVRP